MNIFSFSFGFGLREKSWKFRFPGGGVFCNFIFGLREKSWKFGFSGGVFCNFGFGLREKSWKFGFPGGGYSVTSDLDLGKKVGNLDFRGGGYSVTSDLDLGKKVGNLDFWGGVFCNFGFGLREKSWKFRFSGGGRGVFCKGDGKRKKPTLEKNLPDQFGIIPKSPIPSGLPNQC